MSSQEIPAEASGPGAGDDARLEACRGLTASAELLRRTADSEADWILEVTSALVRCFRAGNKVLSCGNGGSASQADHAAAELAGKYYLDRKALPAISLVDNPANVTAVSNDLGYENIFARQIEGLGSPGDVLLAFTTSGRSPNMIEAVKKARGMKILTVGFTGAAGGDFAALCDHCLVVPSDDTPRIQEVHLAVAHSICALTEAALFERR